MVKYRKGDVILDLNGLPIATGENMVGRQIDMFFVEGSLLLCYRRGFF